MAIRAKASTPSSQTTITDLDLRKNSQDLGLLGSVLGSKEHAPIYIAGAIAIGGVLVMGLVSIDPWTTDQSRIDLIKGMGTIVLACLSFLGGAYSSRPR